MYMPYRRGVQQFPHQFIAVTPHVTTANYYKKNFFQKEFNKSDVIQYHCASNSVLI